MALDGFEEVRGEEVFDNVDGECMGFVGKDCHGESLLMEFFKELDHARVGMSSALPILRVMLLEICDDFGASILLIRGEGALDERENAIANEAFNCCHGVGGKLEVF